MNFSQHANFTLIEKYYDIQQYAKLDGAEIWNILHITYHEKDFTIPKKLFNSNSIPFKNNIIVNTKA